MRCECGIGKKLEEAVILFAYEQGFSRRASAAAAMAFHNFTALRSVIERRHSDSKIDDRRVENGRTGDQRTKVTPIPGVTVINTVHTGANEMSGVTINNEGKMSIGNVGDQGIGVGCVDQRIILEKLDQAVDGTKEIGDEILRAKVSAILVEMRECTGGKWKEKIDMIDTLLDSAQKAGGIVGGVWGSWEAIKSGLALLIGQ
jgi:hypothetical protein